MPTPAPSSRLMALLFTDLIDSSRLKVELGDAEYVEHIARPHNDIFRELLALFPSAEESNYTGDGFLATFRSVNDAVSFALLFHHALRTAKWEKVPPSTRVGIHLGDTVEFTGKRSEVKLLASHAADMCARVMDLGGAGQTLLTRAAFDSARQYVRSHPPTGDSPPPEIQWLAHGRYRFKGKEEPMEVFEVGAIGVAPLQAPAGSGKAKRALSAEEEQTLGWRPGTAQEIPGRTEWLLEKKIGEGGFGEVWLARHRRLKDQRVFKFCFDADRLRSFKRELTLSRLIRQGLGDRDDIAGLLDVRVDRPPFFLESDYVASGNLKQWMESRGGMQTVPLETRLKLLADVARAVAAAHSLGIIHKDIKPSNILIEEMPDGTPQPKLADFGIGVLTERDVLEKHQVTETGFTESLALGNDSSRTGTRLYAPPESQLGKPASTAGDVYALGVMLYQLVAGDLTKPLGVGWEADVTDELLREDIRASAHVDADLRLNDSWMYTMTGAAAGVFVHIDPAVRRSSATELAERLENLPVRRKKLAAKARARVKKQESERRAAETKRRMRVLTAGLIVAMLFMLGGLVAGFMINDQKNAALTAQAETARQKRKVEDERDNAKLATVGAQKNLAQSHILRGMSEIEKGNHVRGVSQFFAAYRSAPTAAHEPFPSSARNLISGWSGSLGTLFLHNGAVLAVAFSPDGKTVLTGSEDMTARLWDVATGEPRGKTMQHEDAVRAVAFSPDGKMVLTGSDDKTARLWDSTSGEARGEPMQHQGSINTVVFSPDGKLVLTGSNDKTARLWDATSGDALGKIMEHNRYVSTAAFSPDGKMVLTGSADNTAKLWDAASGESLGKSMQHKDVVAAAVFSPDGKTVLTGSFDKTARLWSVASGKQRGKSMTHYHYVRAVAFSPDGKTVLTGSRDGFARLWDASTGAPVSEFMVHDSSVTAVAFSLNGRTVLTGSRDKTARLWDVASGKPRGKTMQHRSPVLAVAFGPDDQSVLVGCGESTKGEARLWDTSIDEPRGDVMRHHEDVSAVAFSPDGKMVLTGSWDKMARLWDAVSGKQRGEPMMHGKQVSAVAFSPDGKTVLTGSWDKMARLWDVASRKQRGESMEHQYSVSAVAFSPNGKIVLVGCSTVLGRNGEARLWDFGNGTQCKKVLKHEFGVFAVAFSPDRKTVLTGSGFAFGHIGEVRSWDAISGESRGMSWREKEFVKCVVISPDGKYVLTVVGKTARQWEAATGEPRGNSMRHEGSVNGAAFSPDGKTVVTGSGNRAQLWDAATGEPLGRIMRHEDLVHGVAFSPDGKTVITGSADKTARLWDVTLPALDEHDRLQLSVAVRTGLIFDKHGVLHPLTLRQWLERKKQLKAMGGPCDILALPTRTR